MSSRFSLAIAALATILVSSGLSADKEPDYPLGPDSNPQEGVPQGEIKGPFEWTSDIFPGTVREYWVYVPAQYDGTKPACVFILQDGLRRAQGWKIPTVLDNLIHKREAPVQIGIFISPGVVPAPRENAQPRFNRSFEYDGLGDRYARFLIEEILPEVSKTYRLSDDPNDRAIGGASSGAICAFTAAWERPDQFRRVLSTIGTFVSLRGGNEYPVLIRKYEPKPLRVFLQDGTRDLNLYGGDWWMANQTMLSALKYSGYEVAHAWGEGGHNSKHSASIMPDAIRWLWQGYPEPIKAGVPPQRRTNLVIPGEDWELVFEGDAGGYTDSPAANSDGEVFFADKESGIIRKIDLDDSVSQFTDGKPGIGGLMFGADGKLYGCQRKTHVLLRFDVEGNAETVFDQVTPNDLVMLPDGSGYFTDPINRGVWHFTADGKRQQVARGISFPNGVITSPDQTLLFVSDTDGRFVYSFQIQADGSLAHPQEYGHVHVRDSARSSQADGMAVDTQGRRYLATPMGIQVFDQLGRCHLILALPPGVDWVSNVAFGGPKRDTIYITCMNRVFRRRISATGVHTWQPPVQPPRPGL